MKKLGIILSVLAGVAMLGSSGGSVMASSSVDTTPVQVAVAQAEQPYQGIVGAVTTDSDIASGIVILETKNLGEVEVLLADGTIYKVPGQDEVTKDDIEIGDRLAILATVGEDGSYTATRVMIVPSVVMRQHINGVVVAVQNRIMIVMNAAGETMTVELPEGVKGGVVGDFISTAVRKSSGGANPVASGTQTAAEVQTRLQTQLNAVAGQQVATQAKVQTREQTMTRLGEKLEGLALRNKGVLEQVKAKAPESAKTGIQAAIGNCEQRMEQARQAIQNAQQKAGNTQAPQSGQSTNQSGQQRK
ncbi:hypothetical protein ACFLVZ_03180 [Chloroflexota bacterium]